MSAQDFTTTILLDQSPETVFKAIQNVRGWWSEEVEGRTADLNDEFNYHYEDIHRCKIKLTEVIPNKKMVLLIQETTLVLPRTIPNGPTQKRCSKFQQKTTKQNWFLRIRVWYRIMNVTKSVNRAGPIIYKTVCKN